MDLAHHLLMAGKYDEAVGMCVEAAEDANRARAYRDAAALLERAAPHVRDPVERGRLLCRAGEAYWNNTEPGSARSSPRGGDRRPRSSWIVARAAGHRLFWVAAIGSCCARTSRERSSKKARDVLEAAGPSEALAIAYVRLSGLAAFDRSDASGLEYASAPPRSRNAPAPAWLWRGRGTSWPWLRSSSAKLRPDSRISKTATAQRSWGLLVPGRQCRLQRGLGWALHLGLGLKVQTWAARASEAWQDRAGAWPTYIQSLATLYQGRVAEAVELSRTASQRSRDSGHQKMVWRSAVIQAHALAENLRAEEAYSRAAAAIEPR